MRMTLLAAATALALTAGPGLAADKQADPERLAREGAEKLIEALEALIESMPRYDSPVVTEDGDIIIRRRKPDDPAEPDAPDDGEDDPKNI